MKWLVDRAARERAESREPAEKRETFSERGIAVIAVSVAIVMIATMSVEFGTNTNLDAIAAANARDNVRTHFLARSGMNLTNLMIRFQTDVLDKYRNQIGDVQFADFAPMFMSVFGGSPEEVEGYSALLGAGQGKTIKGLGVSAGEFTVEISTEDAKINVNCANGGTESKKALEAKLASLIFFDAFDPVFSEPAGDGWQRRREEQVTAILDYIDRGNSRFGSPGAPEDYGYENLDDKYKPKNNYIDSIGEMRQIRGIDDRFWTLFGDQFTVYGGCKVNIGAVRDVKLIAALIALSAASDDDPVVRDPIKLWKLASVVAEARNLGMAWDDLQQFADFVESPINALGDIVGGDPAAATAALGPGGGSALANLADVEGVKLDVRQKLEQIARVGPRQTYRVEVTAYIGPTSRRFVKRITGIWDTKTTNQNPRDPAYTQGAWVFWKED